ncbi:glycolipid anchored surface protein [Colletotrichum higginsianum]|uniref:1,3-beta-glucanosyltransferase n=2 Tax=Colletotrichum higginsianum TaxID=80884 RepID=H1VLX9_COLHI|nr:1,3-beta-glucanosyltransferase [Colletotrichum higginsianum IMI 349063]OBR06760.1 1,3-beta-glucanosyltransferase [Colletotrichum higginsianum IMI 349063]TIC97359.1 1,3-beta-glucanosyltransferase gel2 [Colletotrichum higginsianum]GJD04645.1 1,3-betaglucanosyltransferase [Colletotrichum higginsianum]CCF41232.1 glycolipid anchored surface protein [Colletotrichum higginsianum]
MLVQTALVALSATLAAAVKPLTVKGNAFVNDAGEKFQIVGVDYQIGGSAAYDPVHNRDPLSNGDVCLRDAALLQRLGANAIRVYNLDPNLNHDACASIFNAAGMYMILDVNSPLPGESLTSVEPWTSYYAAYLNRTFAIVESFKSYPNTLAFFSGNEVMNDVKTAEFVPQYLRAVTRDLKNYVSKHADRPIPVGYSAADVREILVDSWNFLQCAENGDEKDPSRIDLFGLNSYSWCGDSDFKKSTYDQLVSDLKESSVPIFFSEFGCNQVTPRVFTEIGAIYGPDMKDLFSGGLVYEYSQEDNNFGIVKVNDDKSVELLIDYTNLATQYKKVDFKSLQAEKAPANSPKPPKCESSLIKEKGFNNNFTLPDVPPGAQELIDNGIKNKPSGKIISISDWTVKHKVYDVGGKTEITGLAVSPLADSDANTPGTNTGGSTAPAASSTSTPTGTGTASSSTPSTSNNPAVPLRPKVAAMAAPLLALLFL